MSHGNEGSVRAIFYALGANFGIAVAKYFAAFWTGSGSMLAAAIHSTADCANQLLLLLGLALAFVAVAASVVTGNPLWDALGTLAIGIVLMVIAIAVMIEVKGLIVGELAAPQLRAEIEVFVAAQPEVEQVLNVITLAWGDKVVIAVKARMQERFPSAQWVFFEPDAR